MNDPRPHQWMLLSRPSWISAVGLVFCFAVLFFISGASYHSPTDLMLVAGGTIFYVALFDVFRFLLRAPMFRRVPWMVLFLAGVLVTAVLSAAVRALCHALHLSPVLENLIPFSLIAGLGGALGASLVRPKEEKKG